MSQKYGMLLRNGLVVFQFAISVTLIVATVVVNRQMNYMLGDRLGFRKDHTIVVERTDLVAQQTKAFRDELSKINGVEMVSGTSAMPGQENFFGVTFQAMGSNEQVTGRGIISDENYASALGLEMKEGRFLSKDFSTDSFAVVLNEKAVAEFGLTEPIGARLTTPDGFLNAQDGSQIIYTVVGVVKDFHFQSLHQPIAPLIFTNSSRLGDATFMTALRVKSSGFQQTIAAVEEVWKKFVKDTPFNFAFLDQVLTDQYHAEQSTQRIFNIFSFLAIFIACIGLLGLATYSTQQRIREIGIRKVLGATGFNIVTMLSVSFLKLVLLASLIAFPIAWWFMKEWLNDFAYRINLSVWVFLLVAAIAFIVALATVSVQAIRAALANPVSR